MIVYCHNDPCPTEATDVIEWPDGHITPLCATCLNAFAMGATYEHERQGEWRVYSVEDMVGMVQTTALEIGSRITSEMAEGIIGGAWAYDDLDDAIVQFVHYELPKHKLGERADYEYDKARDK
jgi:hypothetical protein